MILTNYYFPLFVGICTISYIVAQCPRIEKSSHITPMDVSEIQDFGFNMFKELAPKSPRENYIFSPFSIWNALVLLYYGSDGNTEFELKKALGATSKSNTLKTWKHLADRYKKDSKTAGDNTFLIENRVYFDTSIPIARCVKRSLPNEVETLAMATQPRQSADVINNLVSRTTHGKITEIVTPNDLVRTNMAILNAAYFKGVWTLQFDPRKTTTKPFVTLDNQKIDVPMMTQLGEFNYGFDHDLKVEVIELPYSKNEFSMFIVLPYENKDFLRVQQSLSGHMLDTLIKDMYNTKKRIYMPKFTLESTFDKEFLKALQTLGIEEAFSSQANFGIFSSNADARLDSGIHKASITVDEKGTEAAAATVLIVNKISTSDMELNRPFFFIIRDNSNKNILFMGSYKYPTKDVSQNVNNNDFPNFNKPSILESPSFRPQADNNYDISNSLNEHRVSQHDFSRPTTNVNQQRIPVGNTFPSKFNENQFPEDQWTKMSLGSVGQVSDRDSNIGFGNRHQGNSRRRQPSISNLPTLSGVGVPPPTFSRQPAFSSGSNSFNNFDRNSNFAPKVPNNLQYPIIFPDPNLSFIENPPFSNPNNPFNLEPSNAFRERFNRLFNSNIPQNGYNPLRDNSFGLQPVITTRSNNFDYGSSTENRPNVIRNNVPNRRHVLNTPFRRVPIIYLVFSKDEK